MVPKKLVAKVAGIIISYMFAEQKHNEQDKPIQSCPNRIVIGDLRHYHGIRAACDKLVSPDASICSGML